MKSILDFLSALAKNNNRDWFAKNKDQYENIKKSLEELSQFLIVEISKFDKEIGKLRPKDNMFRIYRDVRFSKDKSPYKTNLGLFFVPGGKKSGAAGYYLHLEPGKSFIGGGNHMPSPEILKNIRMEIYSDAGSFNRILSEKAFVQTYGHLQGEKLVRPPKGFDPEFQDIELLKHKSFTVIKNLSDDELLSPDFPNKIIDYFKVMKDFNAFLNKSLL
jgi:uncharacterized protein (TIGR02453 family)